MNKMGFLYLIVGIGVIIVSYAIDSTKLALFIVIGGVVALIGLVTIFKKTPTKPRRVEHRHAEHKTVAHHTAPRKHCSHCGKELKHEDYFCQECGGRHVHYRAG